MKRTHAGFTLVEIAIVLVIVGLLLGGVLKGQELIVQARIRNLTNDLQGVATSIYAYQDRYRKLPGDDDLASGRWQGSGKGNGNGVIGATAIQGILTCNGADGELENCLFWQHLRASGLIAGSPTTTEAPSNAAGGLLQVQQGALGLSGLALCASQLPARIANALDAQLDDGKPGTGQVRGTSQADKLQTASGDTAYADDGSTLYVVCKTP